MRRRVFFGGALTGMSVTGAFAAPPKVKEGDVPTTTFGRTGEKVSVIAQGGARMDLQPDVQTAAAHVRGVYDLGVSFFDCSRLYWGGSAEEAYGIGLEGVRKNVFLTSKTVKRTAKEAEEELETSFRLLKTDYLDLWQAHAVQTREDNVRTVQGFRKMAPEEMEDVRKRALVGSGVQTGPGLEYWKKA